MGVWGPSLFSDDVACDVRDYYRELLEDGVEDGAATGQTVEKFRSYLDDSDGVALLALAVTQSKLGRLDSAIRDRGWPCSIAVPTSRRGSTTIRSWFPGAARFSRKPARS